MTRIFYTDSVTMCAGSHVEKARTSGERSAADWSVRRRYGNHRGRPSDGLVKPGAGGVRLDTHQVRSVEGGRWFAPPGQVGPFACQTHAQ